MRVMLPKGLIDTKVKEEVVPLLYLDIFHPDGRKTIRFPSELAKELEACGAIARAVERIGAPPVSEWKSNARTDADGFGFRTEATGSDTVRMWQSCLSKWHHLDCATMNRTMKLSGTYATDDEIVWKAQHLALNVLLFMSSSPEDYQPLSELIRPPRMEGKRFVPGLYRAKFVGETQRKKVKAEP